MKIALVTGASSGMGRETIIQIADRFNGIDQIWAVARRNGRLDELEEELPVPIRKFAIDITREDELGILAAALAKEKPDIKFLVNAAGYGKIGNVGTLSIAEETGMVALNCQALCAVTHLALPYLSKNSRIIQYASAASFLPQPKFAIYAATKSFVLSYSRALAKEVRERGIFVTAVCPGPVRTEFFDIAETTGRISIYKKFTMADPVKVVKKALNDSIMGRMISVYGPFMKAFQLICKVAPHEVILNIMKILS